MTKLRRTISGHVFSLHDCYLTYEEAKAVVAQLRASGYRATVERVYEEKPFAVYKRRVA